MLVTSQVYDDGTGKQAALLCDVYYPVGKEVKNIAFSAKSGIFPKQWRFLKMPKMGAKNRNYLAASDAP